MPSFEVAPAKPATPLANFTAIGSRSIAISLIYQSPWVNGLVEVLRGEDVDHLTRIGVVEGGGQQFRDDSVLPATTYAYRLRAISANGTPGDLSDVIATKTPEADEITAGAVSASKVSESLSRSLLNGGFGVFAGPAGVRRVVRPAVTAIGTGYPSTGPFDTVTGPAKLSTFGSWQTFARLAIRSNVATGLRVRGSVQSSFTVPDTAWSGKVRHFFRVQLIEKASGTVVATRVVTVLNYAAGTAWISQPDAAFEDGVFVAPNGSNPATGWFVSANTDYLLSWSAMMERDGTAASAEMAVAGFVLDFDFVKPGDGLSS